MNRFAFVALMIVACMSAESQADNRFEKILHGLAHASGAQQAYDQANQEEMIAWEETSPVSTGNWSSASYDGNISHEGLTNSCRSCGNPWAGYCGEKRHKKCRPMKCKQPRCGCSSCSRKSFSLFGGKDCGCAKKTCGLEAPACGCASQAPNCDCQMKASCGRKCCRKPLFAGCKKWFQKACKSCQPVGCGCGGEMMEEVPSGELQEPAPPQAPPMPEEEQTTERKLPLRWQLLTAWAKS